jgi:hypothetical protein
MPVSGYYEWEDTPGGKQPHYFTARDGSPVLTIAGLWDEWKNRETGERIKSCTMIIIEPNEFVAEVHDRMPVLLHPNQFEHWLSGNMSRAISPVRAARPNVKRSSLEDAPGFGRGVFRFKCSCEARSIFSGRRALVATGNGIGALALAAARQQRASGALRAAVDPGLDQLAQQLLRAGSGFAALAGIPGPGDEVVVASRPRSMREPAKGNSRCSRSRCRMTSRSVADTGRGR